MGFFLIDKKECLVIETKDDTKEDSYIAGGSSIYSNSKSIVNSYASIIESYWKQTVLYDQSKDQLHVAEDEFWYGLLVNCEDFDPEIHTLLIF